MDNKRSIQPAETGTRLTNMPRLISYQDFAEYGLVFKCVRSTPGVSDYQIVKQTRLSIDRVSDLRACIENEMYTLEGAWREKELQPAASDEMKTTNPVAPEVKNTPVKVGAIYVGKIRELTDEGIAIVRIKGFACHVDGGRLGQMVKFKVKTLRGDFAEVGLVQVLDTNFHEAVTQARTNRKDETYSVRCRNCSAEITADKFEINDGLCDQCWYKKAQQEIARTDRRSGLFGADRAGTW